MKHRKPNRLKGFDYSQDNLYFVTSCAHNRVCCFGEIVVGTGRDLSNNGDHVVGTGRDPSNDNDNVAGPGRDPSYNGNNDKYESIMVLNDYGKIANEQWYWLAQQYPYIILHEFIVMPNHIHGIIEINRGVGTGRDLSNGGGNLVGTGRDLSHGDKNNDGTLIGRDSFNNDNDNGTDNDNVTGTGRDLSLPESKIKSLSELMGAYKTTVSKKIHLEGYAEFAWQRSFHDHIIRDEQSYERIASYIINNANSWKQDKFFNK
ncbi:MAG: hypothetical protein M3015_04535 [Bacteroidota bacterium]|nr:hypothetical protein [Bacteroidota bacterium]